jgi:hypothetical protein
MKFTNTVLSSATWSTRITSYWMVQEKFLDFVDWESEETEEELFANYLMELIGTGWKLLKSSISGDGELRHSWITLLKTIIIITFTIVKCTIYKEPH